MRHVIKHDRRYERRETRYEKRPKNSTKRAKKMVKCESWTEKTKLDVLHMSKVAAIFSKGKT